MTKHDLPLLDISSLEWQDREADKECNLLENTQKAFEYKWPPDVLKQNGEEEKKEE